MRYSSSRAKGFTLIELMVVVAIIAILAAIALPSYNDYVIRGNLIESTNQLSALRAQMEQYYQDARTYAAATGYNWPCSAANLAALSNAKWTYTCPTAGAAAYSLRADGAGIVSNFAYTINNAGVQATLATPASWGSATATDHWIMKKGG